MPREYRSSIPKAAAERVVIRYPNGATRMAEYLVAEEVLGVRYFHETGEPEFEFALKKGKRHGVEYRWDLPGKLTSAEAFVDGIPHGTARQWSQRGELIGTYTMNHGTGIDLWWQERGDGSVYLAEVLYWKDGARHGFEWWMNEDQGTVFIERHHQHGKPHGIWREWNSQGRLRRNFPQYYVNGQKVPKREYLRASLADLTLPPFLLDENRPLRKFPREIALAMHSRKKKP